METRYCIDYVNPRHPLRDDGSINVRYDRVLTLEQAEHDLTLILSFGAKILNLYMGNAVEGKTGEWSPIPMIVDKDDWCSEEWLNSLKSQPKQEWNEQDIEMIDWLIRICEKEHEELCNDRYGHQDIVSDLKRDCRKKWDWLESLKNKVVPQKQWKPSEEQMATLWEVICDYEGKDGAYNIGTEKVLKELYSELKQQL